MSAADAARMLQVLLATLDEGLIELRPISREQGARGSDFIPIDQPAQIAERAAHLARGCDVYFSAIPRVREGRTADDVGLAPACWADLDSPEAVEAIERL